MTRQYKFTNRQITEHTLFGGKKLVSLWIDRRHKTNLLRCTLLNFHRAGLKSTRQYPRFTTLNQYESFLIHLLEATMIL